MRTTLVYVAVAIFIALGALDLSDHAYRTGLASILLALVNLLLLGS